MSSTEPGSGVHPVDSRWDRADVRDAGDQPGPAGPDDRPEPALDQPFNADGLFALRSAVAAHAAELGAGTRLPDAILVAHELSSNAVRHGGGSGRLRLWRSDRLLYCEVSDIGSGLAEPSRAGDTCPSPSVPGGRGLWIVRHLTADMHIEQGPTGMTITATIALPPDAG